jgi:hypothetical protein
MSDYRTIQTLAQDLAACIPEEMRQSPEQKRLAELEAEVSRLQATLTDLLDVIEFHREDVPEEVSVAAELARAALKGGEE